ncbi:uncharacterized protein BO95DRAFT_480512 [Aspergillus brunneoviolaceus CBS 621.78]|uniref:Uncharacterized protein n=1 Tax=Aspergillus brunneoviolaceus CBS 621.78 TaxID=1450534 RepID=A0ACD1GG39_9EURO|nr:hypothetical protein BO95DRAFT_480512 [Aspergillus brunneoviolaceus CBS 621.78]RAH48130.1 hypothetical protein BO95DRAFT_480512 [Aspergillus brunneoviolaceus CBS 621.78]
MKLTYSGLALAALTGLIELASCKTVKFNVNLTWEDGKVAGNTRKAIWTNGQLPGPTLRVKQGDDVEFLVNNSMPFETAIHFHGIVQQGTPWSDGVPGISQAPIQPGDAFLYKWKADAYGTYIYHSHMRAQLDDGLYGAIYVEPADSVERPFSLMTSDQTELQALLDAEKKTQPVIISDWRLFTSEEILQIQEDSGFSSYCASSILVNGKGSVICPGQDQIDSLTRAGESQALGDVKMSDMGCMPPTASRYARYDFDLTKIPKGYFEGCVPAQGPNQVFNVDASKKYVSYDVLSMAGSASLVFSIDNHPMIVYAVDGRYVEPSTTYAINIPAGSRYSVMLKLDQPAGSYTVRAANKYANQIINGTATLTYTNQGSSSPSVTSPQRTVPTSNSRPGSTTSSGQYINELGTVLDRSKSILDDNTLVPFPREPPAAYANKTFILDIAQLSTSYGWRLGNESYPMDLEDVQFPALFDPTSIPTQNMIATLNDTWVDLILNVTTAGQPQHPIHKHSNKFYVIGQGNSAWTYSSVEEAMKKIPTSFNLQTPQMRDTFQTPPSLGAPSWMALRYHVTNPGPFFMHCHIQMHHSGGLAMAIMDGIDAWPEVPVDYELAVMPKH